MTKIFITIPWFLPAFRAGGPVQSIANLVREYTEEVEYYIFCGDTDFNGAALQNIITDEWVQFNNHTQVWYAAPPKISDVLVKQVEEIQPDIIYIIGLFSWHYNIVPLLFCKGPRRILSARGMLHPGALSQKKWKKKIFLQIFKILEFQHKVNFHATDLQEEDYIHRFFGKMSTTFIASNFPNQIGAIPLKKKEIGELHLISVGIVNPMKNILLVIESLENLKGNIQYDIYGAIKDENYWDQCIAKIKLLPKNISVIMHKEIEPKDVKGKLANAHVFILPSKSENFGHAIFEALSAGRPVITSHHTPWNLLKDAHAGINVAVENSNRELQEAIDLFIKMDEEELKIWHNGALSYAESAIDLDKIRHEYKAMFHPLEILI
ncbi:MAG: glycosyltransferase [Ginsengibacter sp.]|jgi:glycosyltransferase involved in cell wall biosynthesis